MKECGTSDETFRRLDAENVAEGDDKGRRKERMMRDKDDDVVHVAEAGVSYKKETQAKERR